LKKVFDASEKALKLENVKVQRAKDEIAGIRAEIEKLQ